MSWAIELNIFGMKIGSFKKSCLKKCDKILKFAILKVGGTAIQLDILHVYEKSCQFLHWAGQWQVYLFWDLNSIVKSFYALKKIDKLSGGLDFGIVYIYNLYIG